MVRGESVTINVVLQCVVMCCMTSGGLKDDQRELMQLHSY